jgi:6-phosphogluconolactonase (cycloisomerase 2 family)
MFATKLAAGTPYAVSVLTQPTNPGQTCSVTNASGAVSMSDVTNIAVSCTTKTYAVGGTVTGLSGSGLVLRDIGGDNLPVSGNGAFSFATAVASGAAYSVSVAAQPTNPVQNCTLTNGTAQGTVGAATVTTVAVVCANVGHFVYAANLGDHSIAAYSIDATTGALKAIPGSPYAGALKASYVTVEPTGRFLYALDANGSLGIAASGIDVYSIDVATGALTVVAGSPFPTDAGALSMTIHQSGKFAYTANVNSMSVSAYALDTTTGAVAPVVGSPFAGGAYPSSIATASGKFAYAANNGGDVWAYVIDAATGALTVVAGGSFKAGLSPSSISVAASGKFAYVANNVSNDVSAFTIDANTGVLAAVAGSPYAAGINPTSAATDPSGTFLYVANGNAAGTPGANNVSGYVIDASTGALKPVPGSPFATDTLSTAIAIDPSGKFLYVANGDPPANNISAFAIDPGTGALTPVPGSPFAAGANPQSIVVSK